MANIEIKDGEYTKTIYSMIKEQRYDHFRLGTTVSKKKSKVLYPKSFHFLVDTISKNNFFIYITIGTMKQLMFCPIFMT